MILPTDRGFDSVVIYDAHDRIAHTRCVMKLRRIDDALERLGRVFIPDRWDPIEYQAHDSHQLAVLEHVLEDIQNAEAFATKIQDDALQQEMLEDVYMRRLLFYDMLDLRRTLEWKAKEKESKEILKKALAIFSKHPR